MGGVVARFVVERIKRIGIVDLSSYSTSTFTSATHPLYFRHQTFTPDILDYDSAIQIIEAIDSAIAHFGYHEYYDNI